MLDLYTRRQQVALMIFLCLFVASIAGSFTGAFVLLERTSPSIETLSPVLQIILVGAVCAVCFVGSSVLSLVVWLGVLKPWYRRHELAPLFEIPAPGDAPRWWRTGAQASAWLFNVLYPASDPRG